MNTLNRLTLTLGTLTAVLALGATSASAKPGKGKHKAPAPFLDLDEDFDLYGTDELDAELPDKRARKRMKRQLRKRGGWALDAREGRKARRMARKAQRNGWWFQDAAGPVGKRGALNRGKRGDGRYSPGVVTFREQRKITKANNKLIRMQTRFFADGHLSPREARKLSKQERKVTRLMRKALRR